MRKFILALSFLSLTAIAQELPFSGMMTLDDLNAMAKGRSEDGASGGTTSRGDDGPDCAGIPTFFPNPRIQPSPRPQKELPLRIMLLEKNAYSQTAQFSVTAEAFVKNLKNEVTVNYGEAVKFKKGSIAFGDEAIREDLLNYNNKLITKYGHQNFLTVLVVKDLRKKTGGAIGYSTKFRGPWQGGVVVIDKDAFSKDANQFMVAKHEIFHFLGVPGIKFQGTGGSIGQGILNYSDLHLTSELGDIDFKVFIPVIDKNTTIISACNFNWDTRTLMREVYFGPAPVLPLFILNSNSKFNAMYYRILKSYDAEFVSKLPKNIY